MSARRPWAWPLVPLYRAGLWVKERLRGEAKRLSWPVVSVGSLSAGGAGKTPVVIALAGLLKDAGWGVDVISRGYGRAGRGVELVQGEDAARFGDEPVVIARRAAVSVWVGAERFAAGAAAEQEHQRTQWTQSKGAMDAMEDETVPRRVHLLDDGFQHRGLARALDVVLVTADDMEDVLLPAGNLREPLSALGRADVVVVREEEIVEGAIEKQIPCGNEKHKGSARIPFPPQPAKALAGDSGFGNDKQEGKKFKAKVWGLMREGAQMWVVRRRLVFPAPMFVFGAGLKPVAFCAIARPESFAAMLLEAGCGVVETVAFQDHHRYTLSDVDGVVKVAQGLGASGFVTTEKDAVKLSAEMRGRLEAVGPVMVAALEVEFVDAAAVVRAIEAKLHEAALQMGRSA